MKVLHVIPSLRPALGGPTEVALNIVKALRKQGIDAEIATTNDNGTEVLDVPLNQRIKYQDVPVWFLPRFEPPIKEFLFSTAITKWLWQHIDDYDILDLHYLFSYASSCAGVIARWQKVPYTVRTQGQLTPWALAQSRLKKQIYASLIEKHNLNRAAVIHCTSQEEAKDLRNFGVKAPTMILPLGVNQPIKIADVQQRLRQRYNISSDTPVVLFLSRLHYKKRPDLLIQSLSQLAAANHNFHLLLAGSGESEYLSYLNNLVESLNLIPRTSFTGFVTGEDKNLLLQSSDIFVLPSFSENFGVAVAEAMAAGLPVIITPGVQIAPEIEEAQAGLVVKGESNQIAQAIAQLLSSPNLRQQMGENGKRLVRDHYSWQIITQKLISEYSKIIEN